MALDYRSVARRATHGATAFRSVAVREGGSPRAHEPKSAQMLFAVFATGFWTDSRDSVDRDRYM